MCTCKVNTYGTTPRRKAKSQPLKAIKKKEIVVKHGNAGSEKSKQVYMATVRKTATNKTELSK